VSSTFVTTPLNIIVLQDRGPAVFNCSSNRNIDWLFYDITGSPCYVNKTTSGKGSYCADISRFTVSSFDLVISKPQFSDAGTYVCAEFGGQKAAALLRVLGKPTWLEIEQSIIFHYFMPYSLIIYSLLIINFGFRPPSVKHPNLSNVYQNWKALVGFEPTPY